MRVMLIYSHLIISSVCLNLGIDSFLMASVYQVTLDKCCYSFFQTHTFLVFENSGISIVN